MCAKLCHTAGGELEQIQFLLGHASVLTTERYLGCKQNLGHPVNDLFELKMDGQAEEGSPDSNAAQATPVRAPLADEVGCQEDRGDNFQRPAPRAIREKEVQAWVEMNHPQWIAGYRQNGTELREAILSDNA